MKLNDVELNRRFDLHKPADRMAELGCDKVREVIKEAAVHIGVRCPDNRETALALTHLETALYFAVAAIVRPLPDDQLPPPEKLVPTA